MANEQTQDTDTTNAIPTNGEPVTGNTTVDTPAVDTGGATTTTESTTSTGTDQDTGSTSSDAGTGTGTDADSQKKTPWFQRRIDQLTAEKWEERRTAENLRKQATDLLAQLAEARKGGAPVVAPVTTADTTAPATTQTAPVTTTPSMSEAEINALAEKRADEISRQRSFNKACNDVAEAGKDEYPDFDQSLRTFQMLGGIPTGLLEVITEMPNAHKILYSLGKDPDLAERVVKLSPARQALELARLENAVSKPVSKPVSAAPRPVTPLDANARAEHDMEKLSMEDFIKAREKQLANRRK